MKKFIPVFMGTLFTLTGAFAQSSATMDAANQTIINACREEKGTFISFKDDKCEYSGCAYVGSNGAVNYDGDNERVTGGCSIADYRNKAKAAYKSELDKKIKELEDAKKEADRIGSRGGNGSLDVGDVNGDGVIDERDIEEARRRVNGGAGGDRGGKEGGAANGSTVDVGAGDAYSCEELVGEGRISSTMPCYKQCKPKRDWKTLWIKKKEGFERKSCVECLLLHPGVYQVKREYLPTDRNGRVIGDTTVNLGAGVSVKTGTIVCRDANGKVVTVSGTSCPSGLSISTGSGSVRPGVGGTVGVGGTIGIGGNAGAGGTQLPDFCHSSKKKDQEKCSEWMANYGRFMCSSGSNLNACTGGASADIYARYGTADCVNCGVGARKQSTWSGVAEVLGAIAPPLAQLGSAYFGARAYERSNEAWAGAAEVGFEQCRLNQQNYLQYLQANELPGLTPAQQQGMNCNGFNLSGYGGLGNGGLNGWYGAGYTPGFIGGMMGPYGMYNPYGGMGGMYGGSLGGAIGGIGIAGGVVSGMYGGYMGGYAQGGYIAGGNMGLATGVVGGGYVAGGYMNGGYAAGGYMNGGYAAGGYMNGGYAAGGIYGGMNGGMMYPAGGVAGGGLVNGISIAGGYNGGYMNGGYAAGGYAAGGYIGGYAQGGYAQGGYMGGYAQGGYAAGMAGGFNPQATNYDQMMQQQGTMYQMNNLMGGGGMNSAMYNPMNAGYGIGGQFGIGGNLYW